MAQTVIGLNDPKARKLWSADLMVSIAKKSYWQRKMMGRGAETTQPVMMLTDLERQAGDMISYDLSVQLSGQPIEGDARAEGHGERLDFYTDKIYIDQSRKPVDCGGRMSRKRTVHDLRKVGRARLTEYWARIFDEQIFMYASGARGINSDYTFPLNYTGRANNPFEAPDPNHLLFGDGTSKATLTSAGKMSRGLIERANTRAAAQGGGATQVAELQPITIAGAEHFVVVMHPYQAHDLRMSTDSGNWMDIQKAAAAAEGASNPIFKDALGMIGGTILHKHKSVVRFDDYGAGANVEAARALFLGRQALVLAFGSAGGGLRFDWSEELMDHGNSIEICAGAIWGVKKSRFNAADFGLMSLDTAASNPDPV
ncbi:MAG: N4-gp56 family major capsid protein [Xanthomonadaceae bacterium]|jgi:N4-gp56 family major capsid protein|nr:N4-gp56 family major capsid protein [Xanthomonadaceae bacterium]